MREITDVKEIQSVLLNSLKRFDAFCRSHGLKYYLSNGTLLGAVKYGGFIAWDDDADVLMPREDYDKLLSLADDLNDDKYELLYPASSSGWKMPYSKFTDKRTVWQEGNVDFGCEVGISLDVFPIDKWHPNGFIAKLQAMRCDVLKRMLIYTMDPNLYTEKKGIKRGVLKAIRFVARRIGYDGVFLRISRFAEKTKRYPNKKLGCVVWTCHSKAEVFSAECFSDGCALSFEDGQYPVPEGYKEYLRALYGEYMKDLPRDRQKSNHRAKIWYKNE